MTAGRGEAVGMRGAGAEQTCHGCRLSPGERVFYTILVVYHGRTPFTDDPAARADRLLYRLWFAPANTRPLPESYRETWGSIEPGAHRGGMMTSGTSQAAE